MSILDAFLNGSNKQIVGVSLTPGIGLEVVVLDKTKKQVVKYGKRDVLYNFSTREIQNTAQFKTQLAELMEELGIAVKTDVNVVLPNILFDFVEAPAEIGDEEIQEMILNKAEEFYLFKREEPISGSCEVVNFNGGTNRKFAYTSFQKNAVEQIKDIIGEIGYNIVSIESSYSATLRGLYLAGYINDLVQENENWTLMLVSSNSYTLFNMEGNNIVSYNDVPLAIKSFSIEEAYQAIIQGASQLLTNFMADKLFIVSQTDDVSADYLKKNIQFSKEVIAIETNKFSTSPVMDFDDGTGLSDKANTMTLTAIGAASGKIDFPFTLNVLQGDPTIKNDTYRIALSGNQEIEIAGATIDAYCILIAAVVAIIGGIVIGGIYTYNGMNDKTLGELTQKLSEVEAQIAELEKVEEKHEEIDITSIIDDVASSNVSALSFYDSISNDIPKNVWLTQYYNKGGRDIAIRGIAENIVDVYEYYKNLRVISPQSDIKLNELKVVTSEESTQEGATNPLAGLNINQDKDRLYSFEISNTQIQTPAPVEGGVDENDLLRKSQTTTLEVPSQQMTPAQ